MKAGARGQIYPDIDDTHDHAPLLVGLHEPDDLTEPNGGKGVGQILRPHSQPWFSLLLAVQKMFGAAGLAPALSKISASHLCLGPRGKKISQKCKIGLELSGDLSHSHPKLV